MNTRKFGMLLAVALVAFLPALARAETPVDESCTVAADGVVEVEVLAGEVKIVGWNEGSVSVTGIAGDEVEELIVECGSGRAEIRTEIVEEHGDLKLGKSKTNLEIRVPVRSALEAETVSASVSASDLLSTFSVATVSGEVELLGVPEAAEVESVSGTVHVQEAISPLSVETVSGEIVLDSVTGEIEASSVSGSIRVLGGIVDDGSLESVSGDVDFNGDVASGGRLQAESHSGVVTLRLPASVSAELRAGSFSGSISNQLAGGVEPTKEGVAGGVELEQDLGSASARIEVETFSGKIELLNQ